MKVTTDHLTPGWLRRNGAPYSEGAVVEEYFDNIDSTNKDKWLIVTTTVKDAKYLNADYITSSHFKREAPAEGPRPKNWLSTPVRANGSPTGLAQSPSLPSSRSWPWRPPWRPR